MFSIAKVNEINELCREFVESSVSGTPECCCKSDPDGRKPKNYKSSRLKHAGSAPGRNWPWNRVSSRSRTRTFPFTSAFLIAIQIAVYIIIYTCFILFSSITYLQLFISRLKNNNKMSSTFRLLFKFSKTIK